MYRSEPPVAAQPAPLVSAQTRCVAAAPGIPVAMAEQVSAADDGVAGLRLLRQRWYRARRDRFSACSLSTFS